MSKYGFPLTINSDQGKEFDNQVLHHVSKLLRSGKTKTTSYHPVSEGLGERFNYTVIAMLAMFATPEKTNWDDLLPFLMMAYNTTVHASTGHTPFRVIFGEECNLPGTLVHKHLQDPSTPIDWENMRCG